jgi:hypothetical protein
MKKIVVAYWYKYFYDIPGDLITFSCETGIEHNTKYEYSKEKRNEIIDLVLDKGLNVMCQRIGENLVIWIDNERFTQR